MRGFYEMRSRESSLSTQRQPICQEFSTTNPASGLGDGVATRDRSCRRDDEAAVDADDDHHRACLSDLARSRFKDRVLGYSIRDEIKLAVGRDISLERLKLWLSHREKQASELVGFERGMV